MDINKIVSDVVSFAESNPLLASVAAVILLYLLIRKPKLLFVVIVIVLFWGAVMKMVARLFNAEIFK